MQLSQKIKNFLVSKNCHPQTIDVLKTRSEPLDILLVIQDEKELVFDGTEFGMLLQYPHTDGNLCDYTELINEAKNKNIYTCLATDLWLLVY